jgi:HEAT repeat protein
MQWSSTREQTVLGMRRHWVRRLLQVRLSRLMIVIAISAVLFAAWLFNRDHRDSQHAWTTSQIVALGDDDAVRRRQAAENLHIVERDDLARTIVVLAGALADRDWHVRQAAAQSIAAAIGSSGGFANGALIKQIDLGARALIPVCDDPHEKVRINAIQSLGKLYDTPPIPRLSGPAQSGRTATGSEAGRAADTLSRAMLDPSPHVRAQAVWSFARAGRVCSAAVGPVKDMVESDPDKRVRIAALDALRVGWREDPLLYAFLLGRLKIATDEEEYSHIGWAISALDAPPIESIPALLEALSGADLVRRHSIPIALGKLGPAARSALSALAPLARDEIRDQDGRCPAIDAIRSIDPNSPEAQALIVPLAILIRDSPSELQRQKAMFQLIRFGPAAPQAVGPLREALKSATPDVKQRAIMVLGHVGTAARIVVADLERLTRDDLDLTVRHSAEAAVNRIKAAMRVSPGAGK